MHEVNEKLSIVELQLNGLIRKLHEVVKINKRLEAENKKLKKERDNAIAKMNSPQLSIFGAQTSPESNTDLETVRKEVALCMEEIENCIAILEGK